MKTPLTFLHTADVHIQTFQNLIDEYAPQIKARHVVEPSYLQHVQQYGADTALVERLTGDIETLAKSSQLIVVTCSSIGGVAEALDGMNGCGVHRVDRAMADLAVQQGCNILVLAALESTLEPTQRLLEDSKLALRVSARVSVQLVEGAWEHFQNNEQTEYLNAIAKAINENEDRHDLIVLAQASMAGVSALHRGEVPVLSSPTLGVLRAIKTLSA